MGTAGRAISSHDTVQTIMSGLLCGQSRILVNSGIRTLKFSVFTSWKSQNTRHTNSIMMITAESKDDRKRWHLSWYVVVLHDNLGRFVYNDGHSEVNASNGTVGQASGALSTEPKPNTAAWDTSVNYVTTASVLDHYPYNNVTTELTSTMSNGQLLVFYHHSNEFATCWKSVSS